MRSPSQDKIALRSDSSDSTHPVDRAPRQTSVALGTSRHTTKEIINAYQRNGSVWEAGRELGMCGQSVWERLRGVGYPMRGMRWSKAEEAELTLLIGQCTLGEIARRLGRPYMAVCLKASRLGLTGGTQSKVRKIPRGLGLDKASVRRHMKVIDRYEGRLTQYARSNALDVEVLVQAIQRTDPNWWSAYVAARSDLEHRRCPYCRRTFVPMSGKQQYCSRACAGEARRDRVYFGGKRRDAIGMAQGMCQLCGRAGRKGLSAHHIFGKENDPDDDALVALCRGCHQVVGVLANMSMTDRQQGWENLIGLVMARRKGEQLVKMASGDRGAIIHTCVEFDIFAPTPEEFEHFTGEIA